MAVEGVHDSNIYLPVSGSMVKMKSIQNVSISQNVQENPSVVVGKGISPTEINGPTQATVSVDKILNNNDYIKTLVGFKDISGQFEYGDNLLNFSKACLDNFSVSATINDLPQASFDFTIYGSMSGASASASSTASGDNDIGEIPAEGLIVTFDKGATNAVQSFNYSEIYNKQAIYGIGSKEPGDIRFVGPVQQEASISIEVEDYETEETFSFLSGSKDRNRTIKLDISGDNSILNTFELQNAYLVSESIGAGIGNTIVANLTYRGYKKPVEIENFNLKIKHMSSFQPNVVYEASGLSLINSTNMSASGITNTITSRQTQEVAAGGLPGNPGTFEGQSSDSVNDNLQQDLVYLTPAGSYTIILTELGTITGKFDKNVDNSMIVEFTCLYDNNDGGGPGLPSVTGTINRAGWNYGEGGLSSFAEHLSFEEDWSQNITSISLDGDTINLRQDSAAGYPFSSQIDFIDGARLITSTDDPVYGVNTAGLTQTSQGAITHPDMNDPRITKVRIKLTNLSEINNKTLWLPEFLYLSSA